MSVGGKPLRKVDLLADIRPDVEEEVCDSDTIVLPPPVKPIFVDTCKTGITCIEDYSDGYQPAGPPCATVCRPPTWRGGNTAPLTLLLQ